MELKTIKKFLDQIGFLEKKDKSRGGQIFQKKFNFLHQTFQSDTIEGDIDLRGSEIHKIPENLHFKKSLKIRITKLPDNLTVDGYFLGEGIKQNTLSKGSIFKSSIGFVQCHFNYLPINFTVNGNFSLVDTFINFGVPEGLKVRGILNLVRTHSSDETFPEKITCGGLIINPYNKKGEVNQIPESWKIYGEIKLNLVGIRERDKPLVTRQFKELNSNWHIVQTYF